MHMQIDALKDFIADEGFRTSIDSDGDLQFKYEGWTFWIQVDKKDEEFIKILLPNFWKIESDEEKSKCYKAASKLSCEYKVAKIYVVEYKDAPNVCASMEFFIPDVEFFKKIFLRSARILAAMEKEFASVVTAKES